MIINYKILHPKFLYIFFIFLSLNIFFFSTDKSDAKSFDINNIEISRPFEINFDKNDVIDEGFRKGYIELLSLILNSSDQKKINQIELNKIKSMVNSFTIKEEKFINETYYVKLGVSFNKKKIFNYLEKKNIFPSIPEKKNFLFIPIIISENRKDMFVFYNNRIFEEWNNQFNKLSLIKYILPTEDIEDLDLIKNRFDSIEQYDFKEIISKYDLDYSIIALIFNDEKEVRVLSRIDINGNVILKNQSFFNIDFNNYDQINIMINELKKIYEDHWKSYNQINTSIKLSLNIKVSNVKHLKTSNFEKVLKEQDLVYDFSISKFDKDFTFYQVIFNGTPDIFLKKMSEKDYSFNTQNIIWSLE